MGPIKIKVEGGRVTGLKSKKDREESVLKLEVN